MTYPSFEELVKSLSKTTKQVDVALAELQLKVAEINTKYSARTEFERWRNSQEGKLWKQKKYQAKCGCCAICNELIQLKGSHIDHIKPLSLYPHLALELQNLQIACPACNLSKSNKISAAPTTNSLV